MVSVERRPAARDRRPILESPALVTWALALDVCACLALYLIGRLSPPLTALLHVVLLSSLTFLTFGIDKWRAKRQKRRVSEWNLLLLAALGGALGAAIGMALFRHKTSRPIFVVLVPTLFFIHVVVGALLFFR